MLCLQERVGQWPVKTVLYIFPEDQNTDTTLLSKKEKLN